MSKLIGTNPNQVPSNADLGSAAFMDAKDFLTSRGSSLSAIDTIIPKTAVDVFIYDTSKDSDGGAWRKRTQHTSWYNERLNTTTRGSRKDFPAVAVIVSETTQVTIYDGDHPDMPMWMVFNILSGNMAGGGNQLAVTMLNGILVTGASGYAMQIEFISDRGVDWFTNQKYLYKGNIEQRNDTLAFNLIESYGIVNNVVNDVAMTVLPNAPIDAATGLPVPTIAVATSGGTSVIRDDGSVVDITTNNASYTSTHSVKFKDGGVYNQFGQAGNGAYSYYYIFNTIPAADTQISLNNLTATGQAPDAFGTANVGVGNTFDLIGGGSTVLREIEPVAAGGDRGLTMLSGNLGVRSQNEVAFVTSTYNTGWMPGDIKLATLSDTSAADVTGTELVTNGTFDSDTSGWSVSGFSQSSGVITSSTSTSQADQTITTTSGETYVVSFDITANHADGQNGVYIRNSDSSSHVDFRVSDQTGSFSGTFQATGSSMVIRLYNGSSAGTVSYDNISVRIAEEDRSVNGNGLQVFGTVKKTPVAAGADLVSYSGFSASNYIHQPHNDDLSFGVGDYSVMCWFNSSLTTGAGYLFDRGDSAGHSRIAAYLQTGGNVVTYTTNSAGTVAYAAYANSYINSAWYLYTAVRRSAVIYTYVNGRLLGSFYQNQSLNNDDAPLSVGTRYNKVEGFVGSLALMRWSATAPSEEQIKKIYDDEKALFQENAKATLYGTSNAITALAYDNDTKLLHAGTSAGRSVFQGLRRIDNTTDAVGTAISAVNGMVVEE